MEDLVSAQTPFGFITSFKGYKEPKDNTILLHTSRGVEYVERDKVSSNSDVIDQYKVTISNATAEHAGTPDKNGMYRIISNPRIMAPGEVCTQSYRFVDTFKDIDSAISCMKYIKTKIVRMLILPTLASQHITKESFRYVPLQDFTSSSDIDWTQNIPDIDRQLYTKYNLSDDEIAFIEKMIKPMD